MNKYGILAITLLAVVASAWSYLRILGIVTFYTFLLSFVAAVIGSIIMAFLYIKEQWSARKARIAEHEANRSYFDSQRARHDEAAKEAPRIIGAFLHQIEAGLITIEDFSTLATKQLPRAIKDKALDAVLGPPTQKQMPEIVHLEDYVEKGKVTLDHMFMGIDDKGEAVYSNFRTMFHIILAGTTRWGKSVLAQSLLTQMLMASQDDMKYYLIDTGGTTFVDFNLPFVDLPEDAEELIDDLMMELETRRELFKETKAKNIEVHNSRVDPKDKLARLVVIIDEGMDLMDQADSMGDAIKRLVSWAAKYGLHVVFISQSVKTSVLDNSIRGNFSSKFQFRAEGPHQARTLIGDSEAHTIGVRGRSFAVVNGSPTMQLQCPHVREETMAQAGLLFREPNIAFTTEPPQGEVVIDLAEESMKCAHPLLIGETPEEIGRVIDAYWEMVNSSRRFSWNRLARTIYDKSGGTYNEKIREILDTYQIDYEKYL